MNFNSCFVVLLWCACCWHIAGIFALTNFQTRHFYEINRNICDIVFSQQYIELHYTNSCIDCMCYMYDILIDIFRYNDVASCWYCCFIMSFEVHQIWMCNKEFEIRIFRSSIFFKTTVIFSKRRENLHFELLISKIIRTSSILRICASLINLTTIHNDVMISTWILLSYENFVMSRAWVNCIVWLAKREQ